MQAGAEGSAVEIRAERWKARVVGLRYTDRPVIADI